MKCTTQFCRNEAAKGRTKCWKCVKRQQRERNPIKESYYTLKYHAKERGKEFSLTFEEFEKFCKKTNYMIGKGRSKDGYHINRIDETKGYTVDNIQVLSNSENVKKYLVYSHNENGKPENFKFIERSK